VVAHGRLRQFLGWATGKDPASIGFVTGAHGKPELSDAAVQFSLSHSGPVAAAAVAFFPIGIDIEMLDSVNLRVADMYFSPAERTGLRNLPAASVSPAFLRCWTRKEALLKACGTGLAAPLDSFSVSFLPHEPPRVTWVADDPTGPDEWEICHLDLGPSCLGAVAARRKGWGVRGWSDGPAAGTNLLAT